MFLHGSSQNHFCCIQVKLVVLFAQCKGPALLTVFCEEHCKGVLPFKHLALEISETSYTHCYYISRQVELEPSNSSSSSHTGNINILVSCIFTDQAQDELEVNINIMYDHIIFIIFIQSKSAEMGDEKFPLTVN